MEKNKASVTRSQQTIEGWLGIGGNPSKGTLLGRVDQLVWLWFTVYQYRYQDRMPDAHWKTNTMMNGQHSAPGWCKQCSYSDVDGTLFLCELVRDLVDQKYDCKVTWTVYIIKVELAMLRYQLKFLITKIHWDFLAWKNQTEPTSFWSNYSDPHTTWAPKWWFRKGNSLISGKPRFVKYYLAGGFIFLIFNPTWGNDPIWLIFFKWVETMN